MNLPWSQAVQRLQDDEPGRGYPQLFFDAFGTDVVTPELTVKAVAQFVRTMVSSDSKFDLWRRGETELSEEEYNGYQIFLREGGDPEVVPGGQFGGDCFHCHGEAGMQFTDNLMHNNGLDSVFVADPGFAGVTATPGFWKIPHANASQRGVVRPTCTTAGSSPWNRSSTTTTRAGCLQARLTPS